MVIESGSYGRLDRLLHWIALEPELVRRVTFDIEASVRKRQLASASTQLSTRPVYVCGLARSGTTILMRTLERMPEFNSLKYRDMPFVLAPATWGLIGGRFRKSLPPSERAHGDGLMVDLESPEAFEEVFWSTFSKRSPGGNCLGYEKPSPELMGRFAVFRRMVLAARGASATGRYLSKNNNNILRLDSLLEDGDAHVLLSYRDPLATAESLHRQHQLFTERQHGDEFILKYMRWLGHFEFGKGHMPFCFAGGRSISSNKPDTRDYWLAYWIAVHEYLLDRRELRFRLLNHESLCASPEAMLVSVVDVIGARKEEVSGAEILRPRTPSTEQIDGFAGALVERARETYRKLADDRRNIRTGCGP